MKKLKKGMKVRCPHWGGEEEATVFYVNPHTGRVEIRYRGSKAVIEVDVAELKY